MDNVNFEQDEIVAQNGNPVRCRVSVTPASEAPQIVLTVEIVGQNVFFETQNGPSKKRQFLFDSAGFMQTKLCEMSLQVRSDQPGTTILTTYTANSNRPKIKLTIQDGPVIT